MCKQCKEYRDSFYRKRMYTSREALTKQRAEQYARRYLHLLQKYNPNPKDLYVVLERDPAIYTDENIRIVVYKRL